MKLGVVSDTHNNKKNILSLIRIFNENFVDLVIHTGDITSKSSLKLFENLESKLVGVFGNNDRGEKHLPEISRNLGFDFKEPPRVLKLVDKEIAIFHEPDFIEDFIYKNPNTDLILHGHTHRYRKEIIKPSTPIPNYFPLKVLINIISKTYRLISHMKK